VDDWTRIIASRRMEAPSDRQKEIANVGSDAVTDVIQPFPKFAAPRVGRRL
jgi:hypothetical protein